MAKVDQLISEQNVAHYRRRLHMGAEPVTREVVLKLLLAEEKMLGLTREQLARIDGHIEKLRRIIAHEQKLIERRKLIGIDTEPSTLLLATFNDLMATYQLHRQRIVAALADGKSA